MCMYIDEQLLSDEKFSGISITWSSILTVFGAGSEVTGHLKVFGTHEPRVDMIYPDCEGLCLEIQTFIQKTQAY